MRPEDVTKHGQTLLDAIKSDAEQLAAETAVTILVGVAHNLARIAHHHIPEKPE
ncbi:hypothetical protein [Novosphingobium sp.]|uniref:hypothetical protein n=1 Tax=Novosphingobium sp. TaxID=1874826 RepID=UPI002639DA2F|nr:hypothetical protein [Novosphingobium sp.]